jgi:hypothetical protein
MTDEQVQSNNATTRGPRWLPGLLIVLATVLAVVSTLTTWTRSQALDTDQWVEVSSDLLAEPEVQEALAIYLTNELYAAVDVTSELQSVLPDNLSGLAGPLAGALRGPTTDGIEKIVASSAFQSVWQDANRTAHEAAVRILRDETNAESISTSGGDIVLNLNTAVRNLGEAVGIPAAALDRLPDDVGQIKILRSDELGAAQNAVKILDFTSWFLFVLVVVLYAAAVYLAVGRRRQALRSVGVSLIVGGLTLLFLRRAGIRVSVDHYVQDAGNKSLAELVGSVLTELLRQLAWTGIVYGLLIIGFSVLIGPHRWAVDFRRWVAGKADSTAALLGISLGAVLLLLWWSPGNAFDRWVSAVVLVALVIGAIYTVVLTGRQELLAADAGSSLPRPEPAAEESLERT